MRAAAKRAIARGTVGQTTEKVGWSGREFVLGIIDTNDWAVAEHGPWTGTGYTEIRSVHETRKEAVAERARQNNEHGRIKVGRFVLLKRGDDGTWGAA